MRTIIEGGLVMATGLLIVLVLGAVVRRLLGVRLGPLRSALAVLLALLMTGPLLRTLLPQAGPLDGGTALASTTLVVGCAAVAAMVILVVAEVVLPAGTLPAPTRWPAGWAARLGRTRRYAEILRIAVRHGLGRFLRRHLRRGASRAVTDVGLARSLRRALDDGGITFVKLGQQLSARSDLLPPVFVQELAALQDAAAPVPWPEMRAVLETELGRPVGELFASVDASALAAASVAQVHAARLPDGTRVVIKVQRPGVATVVERDLGILVRLARLLERRTAWAAPLGLATLVAGFAKALREELDFTIERNNLAAVRVALSSAGGSQVRVPAPCDWMSTRRVLVMEQLSGWPLRSAEPQLAAFGPERRRHMATALLNVVLEQVLDHGLFHADLHPGNVIVQPDGSLGMLDLGSVGRLDGTSRLAVGRLLAALRATDSSGASDALLELVDRPERVDERALERGVAGVLLRHAAPGVAPPTAVTGPVVAALFRLITAHRLAVPPQVAAIFRAFATLEGTLRLIDPDFDLLGQAQRISHRRLVQTLAPGRLRRTAEDELIAILPVLRRLPRRMDRLAGALQSGRITVNVRLFAEARDRRYVTELFHQLLLAVVGSAAGVMAVLLLDVRGGPELTDTVRLFPVLGSGLLLVAAVLVLRVLMAVFRRSRQ
jgi:ubiquinone biosynthesis protein